MTYGVEHASAALLQRKRDRQLLYRCCLDEQLEEKTLLKSQQQCERQIERERLAELVSQARNEMRSTKKGRMKLEYQYRQENQQIARNKTSQKINYIPTQSCFDQIIEENEQRRRQKKMRLHQQISENQRSAQLQKKQQQLQNQREMQQKKNYEQYVEQEYQTKDAERRFFEDRCLHLVQRFTQKPRGEAHEGLERENYPPSSAYNSVRPAKRVSHKNIESLSNEPYRQNHEQFLPVVRQNSPALNMPGLEIPKGKTERQNGEEENYSYSGRTPRQYILYDVLLGTRKLVRG